MQAIIALVFFTITVVYFVKRYRQESLRQRALAWPHTTALLPDGKDKLQIREVNNKGVPLYYAAKLERPYTFYVRGTAYSGNLIAPYYKKMFYSEAKALLEVLAAHRSYRVYYDPDDPTINFLTPGQPHLPPHHLLAYASFGFTLPVIFLVFDFSRRLRRPDNWSEGIVYILGFSILLASYSLYWRPSKHKLGELLQPTRPG